MGFRKEDCQKALEKNNMVVEEAALWLTENCTPLRKKLSKEKSSQDGGLSLTGMEVSLSGYYYSNDKKRSRSFCKVIYYCCY